MNDEMVHGDVKPRQFSPEMNGANLRQQLLQRPLKGNIRRCQESDIPWMMALAAEAYPDAAQADSQATATWLAERMRQPEIVFLRGDRSIGIAHLTHRFWVPGHWQAYLLFLYAGKVAKENVWEPFHLLDALVEWAKLGNATKFWFGDITGYDFEAYAKRRGGSLAGRTYVLDLGGAQGPFG